MQSAEDVCDKIEARLKEAEKVLKQIHAVAPSKWSKYAKARPLKNRLQDIKDNITDYLDEALTEVALETHDVVYQKIMPLSIGLNNVL